MAFLSLPDGNRLAIPDNPTEAYLDNLESELAQIYPEGYGERTVAGYVSEFGKAIPRGLASTFLTAAEGVGSLANAVTDSVGLESLIDAGEENELISIAREGREALNESFLGADAAYRDKWITKAGEALGSFASFAIPGTAVMKLTSLQGAKAMLPILPLASTAGAGEASQRVEAARASGLNVTQEQENASVMWGSLIGATELAPVHNILRRINKLAPPKFKNVWMNRIQEAVVSGGLEGAQEVAASLMQDAVEKGYYNPDLDFGESWWEEFTLGGFAGFAGDLALRALGGRRFSVTDQGWLDKETDSRKRRAEGLERQRAVLEQAEKDLTFPALPAPDPELTPDQITIEDGEDPVAFANRLSITLGDRFPLNTIWSTVPVSEGLVSVQDREGVTYGQPMTLEEGTIVAGELNNQQFADAINREVNNKIALTGDYPSGRQRRLVEEAGQRILDPEQFTFPAFAIDFYGGTTSLDEGYNESLTWQEIEEEGQQRPWRKLTKTQEMNKARAAEGKPPLNNFSVEQAKQALTEEQFRAMVDGKVEALTNAGIIYTQEYVDDLVVLAKERTAKGKLSNKKESRQAREELKALEDALLVEAVEDPAETGMPEKLRFGRYNLIADQAEARALKRMARVVDKKFTTRGVRPPPGMGENVHQTRAALETIAQQKNISFDPSSPAWKFFFKQVTGKEKLGPVRRAHRKADEMSPDETALVWLEMMQLPSFPTLTTLPDFSPSSLNANQYDAAKTAVIASGRVSNDLLKEAMSIEGRKVRSATISEARRLLAAEGVIPTPQSRSVTEVGEPAPTEDVVTINEPVTLAEDTDLQVKITRDVMDKTVRGRGVNNINSRILGIIDAATGRARDLETGREVIGSEALASYSAALNRVTVVVGELDPAVTEEMLAQDVAGRVNHELIHAMRELDLFTEGEWKALTKYAESAIEPISGLTFLERAQLPRDQGGYAEQSITIQIEESVAELYRNHVQGLLEKAVTGKPRSLLDRITHFFSRMVEVVRGTPDALGVLEAITSGEIGGRPAEIRTLRETEAEIRALEETPTTAVPGARAADAPPEAIVGERVSDLPPPSDREMRGGWYGPEQGMRPIGEIPHNELTQQQRDQLRRMSKMHFDTTTVWYHGTSEVVEGAGEDTEAFDMFMSTRDKGWDSQWMADLGTWFTDEPQVADHFARAEDGYILPAYLRMRNPKNFYGYEALEEDYAESPAASVQEYVANLQAEGYDSIEIESSFTDVEVSRTDAVVFESDQVRSAISAKFDPARAAEPGLREMRAPTQEQIDEAVATVDQQAEEAVANGTVPRFSTKASPEAKYVALNPDEGMKLPQDMSERFMLSNVPVLPDRIQKIMNRRLPYEPEGQRETFGQRVLGTLNVESGSELATRLREDLVYRYARWEPIGREMAAKDARTLWADSSAIAAMNMADLSGGYIASAWKWGQIAYKDGGYMVEDVAMENGEMTGGLLDILEPIYKDQNKSRLWQLYMIERRARYSNSQGKLLDIPDSELKSEWDDVSAEVEANYPELIEVAEKYDAWNNQLIQFMTDTGLVNKETAQEWIDSSFYYPFYRQMEGEEAGRDRVFKTRLMTGANSLVRQKLEGSRREFITDPIEAIGKNLSAAITAGMKNVAGQRAMRDAVALGYGEEVKQKKDGNYTILIDGKERHYAIGDLQLVASLMSMSQGELTPIINVLAKPASLLRSLVTKSPDFMAAAIFRDVGSAAVTSGASLPKLAGAVKNAFGPLENMERRGFGLGYDFQNDPRQVKEWYKQEYRKRGVGGHGLMPMDAFRRVWDALGQASTRSDVAIRQSVYEDVLARTGNEAEAIYQGWEVINFSRRGASPTFRVLTASIPFLNARIQGLDVFYRAARGRYSSDPRKNREMVRRTFIYRSLLMAGLTGLYYALVSDTEDYKEATTIEKDMNYIIPVLGGLKLPVPFEVGFLFKTMPEKILDTIYGTSTGGDLAGTIGRGFGSTFEFNPLGIQAIAPLVEMYYNKSFFTGREIVPYYMLGQESFMQTRWDTPLFAQNLGKALNISPLKIDHLMRGYTGTLGTYAIDLSDAVAREFAGPEYQVPKRLQDFPVVRRFYQGVGSGYQQMFYDLDSDVQRMVQTFNKLQKDGRMDEAYAYYLTRPELLESKEMVNAISRFMDSYRERRDAIRNSDIPDDTKRDLLDQLDEEKNRLLKEIPQMRKDIGSPFLRLGNTVGL